MNDQGVSVIIRETFKNPSLGNVSSFPTKVKQDDRASLNETVARLLREDDRDADQDADEDDEEENVIVEEELDTGWHEDE